MDLPQFAIEAQGLVKTYPATKTTPEMKALRGIDLAIPRGSIFGLLGPNGAGKSTFINTLAGLTKKTSGTVKIWGRDIDTHPRDARAAIGVVPQEIAADPFFPSFIAGLEDEFSVTGQALVLAVATPGRQEAETYRALAADRRVDGVILTDIRASDPRVELVQHLGISAVTLGVPDVASPFTSVSADDGAGIRLVVEHLASLGHRRVAHVAGLLMDVCGSPVAETEIEIKPRGKKFVSLWVTCTVHSGEMVTEALRVAKADARVMTCW